jgi:Bardet-Biedl syndrome 5 protein
MLYSSLIGREIANMSTELQDFMPDREIGFDYPESHMALVPGEFIAKKFCQVEDKKGNPGIYGDLLVTNLRVIWIQDLMPKVNLSIGYNVFLKMALVQPEVNVDTENVQIKAFHGDSRYEFFFFRKKNSQGTFDILPKIYNAYDGTRGYRELFIRKLISSGGQLIMYEKEKIIKQYPNVWNLGKTEGKLGRFFFTNIRAVWISNTNENFNISVPYTRILRITSKSSNFGEAVGFNTSKHFGGLDIGFKIDSVDFKTVLNEITATWDTYRKNPYLGIPENISTETNTNANIMKKTYFAESELVDTGYNEDQNIRAIYREEGHFSDHEVGYDN